MNGGELINDLQLVPFHPWWQRPAMIVCLILPCMALMAVAYVLFRRRQKSPIPMGSLEPTIDWEAEFRRRLAELRARSTGLTGYELAIHVSSLTREYFFVSRTWASPCQTSRELLQVAGAADGLPAATVGQLRQMVELADRIKFARHEAVSNERTQLLDLAESLLVKRNVTSSAGGTSPNTP